MIRYEITYKGRLKDKWRCLLWHSRVSLPHVASTNYSTKYADECRKCGQRREYWV